MTITQPDSLKEVYVMSGVAELPFFFPVAQAKDLMVYLYDTVLGTESLLVEDTDYTFTASSSPFPSTGSITILDTAVYTDATQQVTITRDTERVQSYDMEFAQDMNPVQLEFEQDRQCMMAQDADQKSSEAIRFPDSEAVTGGLNFLPTKVNRANSVLVFDTNGDFDTSQTLLQDISDSVTEAQTAEANAVIAQTGAETAQTGAETAETNSETARDFAHAWATEAEDVAVDDLVNPSGFSAFHWAQKALGYITAGIHNSLTGLQGGAVGEYYHLTVAKIAEITANTLKVSFPEAPIDGTQYARKDAGWVGILTGFKNILINGDFRINQRAFDGNWAGISLGDYGYDRWKKSAGGITQIIEEGNYKPSTTYTLSGTNVTTSNPTSPASGNWSIEVPDTASNIQLEEGANATLFELRNYESELLMCQRYYSIIGVYERLMNSYTVTVQSYTTKNYPVKMRTSPTLTTSGVSIVAAANAYSPTPDQTFYILSNVDINSFDNVDMTVVADAEL